MTLLAASTALAVLAAALFGGIFAARDVPAPEPAAATAPSAEAHDALAALGISAGARTGRSIEDEARANPSAESFARLGLAHLQRVRDDGDPTGYRRADAALTRAVELDPDSHDALVGLAALAAARHEFIDARRVAQDALAVQSRSTEALGILGDAQLELGQYDAAFRTFDRMSAFRPSLASYSRVAYGRELLGDRPGAIEALSLAIDAGSGEAEHVAFAYVQRGHLHLAGDRLAAAVADYRAAIALVSRYAPALSGLARVEAARGNVDAAIRLNERAVAIVPLPEYPIAMSDLLLASDRARDARDADELVDAMVVLQREAGVQVDLELATYRLDRGEDATAILRDLQRVYRTRRGIQVEDALAWASFKAGDCRAARAYSQRALRLGTLDGLKLFHRAEIERCLAGVESARPWYRRALRADPHFSPLHVSRARQGAA